MTDPTTSDPAVPAGAGPAGAGPADAGPADAGPAGVTASGRGRERQHPTTVPDPVRRVVEYVIYGTLSWLAWFWAAALLVWIVSVVLVDRYGQLDSSIWEFAGLSWTRWVQFAAGCVLAYSTFPVIVAQGLTRRRVAQGSIAGITLLAAIGAAFITVVYVAELVVFGMADVDPGMSERHLFDAPGQLWWVAVETWLVYAVYMASGWFIALAFYRWGTIVGLLLIVPGLLPVAVVESALSSSLLPESVDSVFLDLPVGAAVAVGLATWVATVAVTTRLLRDTPLQSRPR